MSLKDNIEYWKKSLENPENIADEFYITDEIIVTDRDLTKRIERLRELIITFCVVNEKKGDVSGILDEIFNIIQNTDRIQYTEFIAFWKVLDLTYSIYRKLSEKMVVLTNLLHKYCERRRKLYDYLGYTNITVQSLYDFGASRRLGMASLNKLENMILNAFKQAIYVCEYRDFQISKIAYFFPDKGDAELYKDFCTEYNVQYKFGKEHQGKEVDIVLKIQEDFFIIEAKHIKEAGGAQNKQVNEIIEFIKYSEDSKKIHYVSFMDGLYFNRFIWQTSKHCNKINNQINDIVNYLSQNKQNFFVNTFGLKSIFKDLND